MMIFTKDTLPEKEQVINFLEKERSNINLSLKFQQQLKSFILQ